MVNIRPEISSAQIRAARAWLGWSQEFLASRAGVSKRAVVRAESESSQSHSTTSERIRAALEGEGVGFSFDKMIGTGIVVRSAPGLKSLS